MSILDELRKKAEEKKAAERKEAVNKERLEQIYKQKLLPKMQHLLDTLTETIKYLQILEEPIIAKKYSSRYPDFGDLVQSSYRINTDGRMGLADYNRLMEINLHFILEAQGGFTYTVDVESAIEREVAFLQGKRVKFDWKRLDAVNGIPQARFFVERKVPVSFRIEVDYPNSQFKVFIKNQHNFDTFSKTYSPVQLNDTVIDEILSYLLRKDDRLVRAEELSDEHKTAIRAAIQKNFANYQQAYEQSLPSPHNGNNIQVDADPREKAGSIKNIFTRLNKREN